MMQSVVNVNNMLVDWCSSESSFRHGNSMYPMMKWVCLIYICDEMVHSKMALWTGNRHFSVAI